MLVQLFEHSTSSYVRAGPRVVLQVLPMTMTPPGVRGGAPSRADLTRCPGHLGCRSAAGDGGTRHDAGRRGAAFGRGTRPSLCAPVTATPAPPRAVAGRAGSRRPPRHRSTTVKSAVLKHSIWRLFGINLESQWPARVRARREPGGGTEAPGLKSQNWRLAFQKRHSARRARFVHAHARVAGLALTTLNSALDRRWGRRRRQRSQHSHRGRLEPSCTLAAREL
jgi:hypothetical protein